MSISQSYHLDYHGDDPNLQKLFQDADAMLSDLFFNLNKLLIAPATTSSTLSTNLTNLDAVATTGLLTRTALNAWTTRSVAVGSAKLTVANGSGVAGNPTLDLGSVATTDLSNSAKVVLTDVANTLSGANIFSGLNRFTGSYQEFAGGLILSAANSPAALASGRTDNWAPGGGIGATDVLRVTTNAANSAVSGIVPGEGGQVMFLINLGTGTLTLNHEDVNSSAGNRFSLKSAANLVYASGQVGWLYYDTASSRWRAGAE